MTEMKQILVCKNNIKKLILPLRRQSVSCMQAFHFIVMLLFKNLAFCFGFYTLRLTCRKISLAADTVEHMTSCP